MKLICYFPWARGDWAKLLRGLEGASISPNLKGFSIFILIANTEAFSSLFWQILDSPQEKPQSHTWTFDHQAYKPYPNHKKHWVAMSRGGMMHLLTKMINQESKIWLRESATLKASHYIMILHKDQVKLPYQT